MAYLFKLESGDYGIRGATGSRRVSQEEFDAGVVPDRGKAVHIPPGSNWEAWVLHELHVYDNAA